MGFLECMMMKLGFARKWVDLILNCITSISYSVNVNGVHGNDFKPSRGLRQSDSLSSYLFLICSEGHSALMQRVRSDGSMKGVLVSKRGSHLSHLLFANDCIFFSEATDHGVQIIKDVLKVYEECSSQYVNFNKSIIYFNMNSDEDFKKFVSHNLGMKESMNPEAYLGLPNFVGKGKWASFQYLKDQM